MEPIWIIPSLMLLCGAAGFIGAWRHYRSLIDAAGFGLPMGALTGLLLAGVVLTFWEYFNTGFC